MDCGREPKAKDTEPLTPARKISRRAMVAGTVATVAVAAALPLPNFAFAGTSDEDMVAFLVLSAALTGVDIHTLAPEFSRGSGDILSADPGIDPINIKSAYFRQVKNAPGTASPFAKLLQIAKDNRLSQDNIIAKVNASDDDTKFLARSIVLLWYLGSWYEPGDLKNAAKPEVSPVPIKQRVLSAKTYTQGLVWQIVGAHPMGYSNLQFGYWSRDPHDPNSGVDLFSPAKFPL